MVLFHKLLVCISTCPLTWDITACPSTWVIDDCSRITPFPAVFAASYAHGKKSTLLLFPNLTCEVGAAVSTPDSVRLNVSMAAPSVGQPGISFSYSTTSRLATKLLASDTPDHTCLFSLKSSLGQNATHQKLRLTLLQIEIEKLPIFNFVRN